VKKEETFLKKDLIERGWTDLGIEQILEKPDKVVKNSYYGKSYVYDKRRVKEAEKTSAFFYHKNITKIKKILETSNVKKINKQDLKELNIPISISRTAQKKELIYVFFKRTKEFNEDINEELILKYKLEEMLSILRNNSFKEDISEEEIEKSRFLKELKVFCKSVGTTFTPLKKEFLKNPTSDNLEKIKETFFEEKREKEKKLRKLTAVEDIENFYFEARSIKRTFKAYLGPTNSGKTYKALKELKEAGTGVYLAPLRLLAREVYDSFIEAGIKVSLITGEEKIIDEEATHICSTIEALDIHTKFDVAVIDEVQFLNDQQRGQAWTRAVYGVYADKVICLGSKNSENILKRILEKTKENIEIEYLERKTPLNPENISYSVKDLRKGDAVIAFSRKNIYSIKKRVEEETDLTVGLIYGMLPPELRVVTAKAFNEGDIDIIIATDAIGIGLNLDIQRIVFTDFSKYNGNDFENITEDLFKQIAGRAGRYKKHEEGLVTICDDLAYRSEPEIWEKYTKNLHKENKEIEYIYFFPEFEHLLKISEELNEEEDLEKIVSTYLKYFSDKDRIFRKNFSFIEENLNAVNHRNLTLYQKYRLLFAPVNKSNYEMFILLVDILEKEQNVNYDSFEFELNQKVKGLEDLISEINICRWMHYQFKDNFEIGELDKIYEYALINLDHQMR